MTDTPGYIHGFDAAEQDRLVRQAEFLAPYFHAGFAFEGCRNALEIGCGVGAQMRILLRHFPKLHITGIDQAQTQIERARLLLAPEIAAGRAVVQHAEGGRLPFPDNHFEAVYLIFVLEHVRAPQPLLAEAARVLRPSGVLFAAEVFNQSLYLYPPAPHTERYWRAFNDCQRALGGDPNVGPRLANLALAADLLVDTLDDVSFMLDARVQDPVARKRVVQYWRELMASGAASLLAGDYIDTSILTGMARELAEIEQNPDALLLYSGRRLKARKAR